MSAIRIVVHAEGPGELGHPGAHVQPRHPLLEDDLGPIHWIVRRILAEDHALPVGAVDFREPLRTTLGKKPRGSMLLVPEVLDQVLAAWMFECPVVVLLVDSDDVAPGERAAVLRDALDRNGLVGAVGVSVREFEAWLVADKGALSSVLGSSVEAVSDPEGLPPGAAKRIATELFEGVASDSRPERALRIEVAQALDLDVVSRVCPSFDRFRLELKALVLTG